MDNKVCVKINCYKGFSYLETLDGVKDVGFKYLELSTSKGNSLNLRQDSTIEELEKLKNDLNSRGLSALAIGGNSYLLDDDTSKILANIKLAKFFGCKYIDTTMFNAHDEKTALANEDDVINHIKFYVPYLEQNDLDLVIELHGNYASGKILRPILDKVGSNHVHINFDTGNALYWGKLSVEEMVQDFKDSVDYVSFMHLKDKLGETTEWNFPAIGSGYIPFKDIFEYLDNKNNSSTLTVEIEFTPEGVKDVGEVNQALIDSYNFLISLGLNI
ncbi:MAG: sugar phosphate isomerase/epimerase family protein [Erysipelotrichaceae bacterium]|nr:sugar phosphate isomerase/epimerase family protein [Erysipelotrichaceae bacterium]